MTIRVNPLVGRFNSPILGTMGDHEVPFKKVPERDWTPLGTQGDDSLTENLGPLLGLGKFPRVGCVPPQRGTPCVIIPGWAPTFGVFPGTHHLGGLSTEEWGE